MSGWRHNFAVVFNGLLLSLHSERGRGLYLTSPHASPLTFKYLCNCLLVV